MAQPKFVFSSERIEGEELFGWRMPMPSIWKFSLLLPDGRTLYRNSEERRPYDDGVWYTQSVDEEADPHIFTLEFWGREEGEWEDHWDKPWEHVIIRAPFRIQHLWHEFGEPEIVLHTMFARVGPFWAETEVPYDMT